MSATHAPADADAPDAEPAIVTEFRERLLARHPECDTVDAALRIEEQRPSTTLASDRGYCPDCGSVKIRKKPSDNTAQRRPEDYECHHCGTHFDRPVSQTAFGREW